MIWDSLFGGLAALVDGVLGGLFSLVPGVPSWVRDEGLQDVLNAVGGISGWLPVEHALNVGSAVVSAYLTAGFVGITRSLLSHVTGGGGAS